MFAGTSCHWFDYEISDEALTKYLPVIGDINIMFPLDKKEELIEVFINKSHSNSRLIFLGFIDELDYSKSVLRTAFKFTNSKNEMFVFETNFIFTQFDKNGPDEFSKFAFSAAWDDIMRTHSMKQYLPNVDRLFTRIGAFHKNVIRAICHYQTFPGKLVTASSTQAKERLSKKQHPLHAIAFSIRHGARYKYKIEDYSQNYEPSEIRYKALPSNTGHIRDLKEVFRCVFRFEPSDIAISRFHSVMGILSIIDESIHAEILEEAFELTFGKEE
jgi:hypothetical protein